MFGFPDQYVKNVDFSGIVPALLSASFCKWINFSKKRASFGCVLFWIIFCIEIEQVKTKETEDDMKPRQAVRILMLSPIYFRLRPVDRWQLVQEYCRTMDAIFSTIH